ncbi:MAG: hypothetical protein ACO3FI_12870, partial [Cyclobacteriaceae bacterium]
MMKIFLSAFIILQIVTCQLRGQSSLQLMGINRVEHSIEPEMKYEPPHTDDLSSWYQLFFL